MTVLFATHPAYLEHVAGRHHPECPERLNAVIEGAYRADVADALVPLAPEPAPMEALQRVHPAGYIAHIEAVALAGGGRLDADTLMSAGSWEAARLAAGAGLTAIDAMRRGEGDAAFCAVRPPGHHASSTVSMGFCLLSNVAVAAMSLADAGERVMILDYDAHHGNGTQAVFVEDPRVLFVSFHQWPLYPGTGPPDEIGIGAGLGFTMNLPMPPDATGDHYLRAFDEIVVPRAATFAPTWLIISAGFDGHRNDPITELGLSSGDYGLLTARAMALVPPGRRLVMLEGGYDFEALTLCTAAALGALEGRDVLPEKPTSGGPGQRYVDHCRDLWARIDAPAGS